MSNAIPSHADEHYPGEPAPVTMLRELQEAVYGHSFATPHSPQEEWRQLLALVRARGQG